MKKPLIILLLAILVLYPMFVAFPIGRCEDEVLYDPIHIYYMGSKISDSPGPIVFTGPCTTEYFEITVKVQWDSLPDPTKVNWADVSMVEKTSFGITFVPLSTTLHNPTPNSIFVVVHVPTAGLPAGTYAANIYANVTAQGPKNTPTVAGTNGFFQFVKTPCLPTTAKVTFDQVGVSNDFTGTILTVDSVNYGYGDLPKDFDWLIGSTHSFEYHAELTVDAGKKYVWYQTSGLSPDRLGSITVASGGGAVTGWYKTQYYLTVTSPHDTPGEMGWYDKNTNAHATLTDGVVPDGAGTQYVFTAWSGDASGTGLTSDDIYMDGPKTAVANWKTQYYLTVNSLYDTPGGADWYDENTYAYATLVTGTVDITPGWVRAVFTGWGGDASGTGLTSDQIYMNGPKTAIANWKIQYYLQVVSDPSLIPPMPGADWYDYCTHVTLTADAFYPSEAGEGGVRYRFDYWDVDGTPVSGNPIDVHMDTYHTATAHYVVEYYLTLTTSPPAINSPSGEGWYDGGTYAPISTDYHVYIDAGSRWRFNGWTTDDMTEIAASGSRSTTVLMDKAKTVTANYVKQYYLTVQTDPSGLTPAPTPASTWHDEDTDVTETAQSVAGYIFVYWDLDGESLPGRGILINPITVRMNGPHTVTAHYWTELEFENYVTDSNFRQIDHFDTVFTPLDTKKTKFKLSATNPGQFMYNIEVTNTWPVKIDTLTITFDIPSDFVLKGADPIQVWTGYGKTGTRIAATKGGGTLTINNIAAGATVYATFHIEYKYTGQSFTKAQKDAWKTTHGSPLLNGKYTFSAGYTAVWDSLTASASSSTILDDPTVTLGE